MAAKKEPLKIGNTSFSPDLVESLKGKTAEEIKADRPGLHPNIIAEFVKLYKPKKKTTPKPKKKDSEEK